MGGLLPRACLLGAPCLAEEGPEQVEVYGLEGAEVIDSRKAGIVDY